MPSDSEIKEMKQFIFDRLNNIKEINYSNNKELSSIIDKIIDLDEEFLDMQQTSFSNDDEIRYIQKNTGYDFQFIDKILWERYCYEMKNDYWEYKIDYCVNCGEGPLYFKEIPSKERSEKIVCKNCKFEMQIGRNGLEPMDN